jgi:hypothetical protein
MVKYLVDSKMVNKGAVDANFVRLIFSGLISDAKDEVNPLMRAKAMRDGRNATTERVVTSPGSADSDLTYYMGDLEDIQRNDEIIPIVEISGIWYINNSAGMLVRLVDVMVFKKTSDTTPRFNLPGVAGVKQVERDDAPAPRDEDAEEAVDPAPLQDEEPHVASDPFDDSL